MNSTAIIGLTATSVSIVPMVPQAIHCWKSKSTKDISFSAFLLMALGSTLWFTYGVLQKDVIIYSANFIVGSMAIVILMAKLRYT